MSYRTVDLSRGIQWLVEAVQLVMKAPAVFLVQALILAILAIIPIIGQLAMLVLGPALLAGMVWSMREADRGGEPTIGQLFEGFNQPGKIGALIALCLPAIAGGVILFVLGFLFLGGALLGAAMGGGDAAAAFGLGGGMLLWLLVCLLVALAIYSLVVFAIPRVMFDGQEPFAAMKESLAASLANIGPLLVFSLVFFIGGLIMMLVLSIIPILGTIVAYLILNAVVAGAIYVAYKDVWGTGGALAETVIVPPAPPPSAPPPAPPTE